MNSEDASVNSSHREGFNYLVLETMDDVLKHVFGEGGAEIIFRYAKKSAPSKWEEVPKRVEVLADALRRLLGVSSTLLENLILKSVYSKFELKFEKKKDYDFLDYVKEAGRR